MIFIDANVLLDFFLRRKPFAEEAFQLFSHAHRVEEEMAISTLSVSHCFYFVQKHLDTATAYNALEKLQSLFTLKETDSEHIARAMELKWNAFEDAIQLAIAESNAADKIVSRDAGFAESTIDVLTVQEALVYLENK